MHKRKNALFVGSAKNGDNLAVIATLFENCKLSGINPHNWLTQALGALANGHHTTSCHGSPCLKNSACRDLESFSGSFHFRCAPHGCRHVSSAAPQRVRNKTESSQTPLTLTQCETLHRPACQEEHS